MGSIIEKIHHDINTAYLEKFQTCSETIDREVVETQKYDIANLGFKSYESERAKFEKIKHSKEFIATVNRLKLDYPYKKFITYDQLGKIMEKYPLVLSTPERFIGEIPKDCMKDILDFKTKEQDDNFFPIPKIDYAIKNYDISSAKIMQLINKILFSYQFQSSLRRDSTDSISERIGVLIQENGLNKRYSNVQRRSY